MLCYVDVYIYALLSISPILIDCFMTVVYPDVIIISSVLWRCMVGISSFPVTSLRGMVTTVTFVVFWLKLLFWFPFITVAGVYFLLEKKYYCTKPSTFFCQLVSLFNQFNQVLTLSSTVPINLCGMHMYVVYPISVGIKEGTYRQGLLDNITLCSRTNF